jgi:hypothetical protein
LDSEIGPGTGWRALWPGKQRDKLFTGAVSDQKISKLFVSHVEASRQDLWV